MSKLGKRRFNETSELIRFHEALSFIRAFPDNRAILGLTERQLATFADRVAQLRRSGADLSALDDETVSGIAGTTVTAAFSYETTLWLAARFPAEVSIDWENQSATERLGATLPRFLPLLWEDSLVEANVPYLDWLKTARGRAAELPWLLKRFSGLPLSEREKAELYESLEIPVRWRLDTMRATRTGMTRRVRSPFYHTGPLIRRGAISLTDELNAGPLPVERLTAAQGEDALHLAREASTIRYRELYGFTNGDPRRVLKARPGRGVEIFVSGAPPERRLPLRAYHAGLIVKNGVPIGYVETLTLFERSEVGFNMYYTFRDGETAWLYANLLRLLRQLLGVTCFAVDPYQIGYENEEAIESGAFWFYRKLGFRPTTAATKRLTEAEERRIMRRAGYRSPSAVLRRLAAASLIYEIDGSGEWDQFQARKIGFAVQRRMARSFRGDSREMRQASIGSVARALTLDLDKLSRAQRCCFEDLALVLALIPDLKGWTAEEKRRLVRIIRAKAGAEESRYVRLMQSHPRLRRSLLKLGSASG